MADDESGKVARAIRKKHSPLVLKIAPPVSAYFPLSRSEPSPLKRDSAGEKVSDLTSEGASQLDYMQAATSCFSS
jgi:hypothetical protein